MGTGENAPPAWRRVLHPSTAAALGLFLAARLILSALGLALWQAGFVPTEPEAGTRPYFGVAPANRGLRGALLGVWQRFDSIHYQRIAENGYSSEDLSAFPPLYPLLSRAGGLLFGGDALAGGLLISNVACLLALIVLHRGLEQEGAPGAVAGRSLAYLLLFPTGFFLLAPYTESLFLLLVVICLREARRERWPAAAAAGFLAALTRLNGAMLSLALLVQALSQSRSSLRGLVARLLAAAAPASGLAAFLLWRDLAGFPSLAEVQLQHWQRLPALPWEAVLQTLQRFARGESQMIEALDLAVVLGMVALGVVVARRLPKPYAVYFWAMLLFALFQLRIGQPLSGVGRYSLALFPAFTILAWWGQRPWANRAILYPFIGLWLYLAGQYVLWGWVG